MQTAQVVSLHLWGVPTRRIPAALAAMALDRRDVTAAAGCTFAKLLGTGRARSFTPRDADLRHWGLLAVWSTPEHLAHFERTHPIPRRWQTRSYERWHAVLRPLAVRGTWARQQPFRPTRGPRAGRVFAYVPVAAITRARLRWRSAYRFWQAVPPVAAAADRASGLLWAVGIGEAPVGLQGTFSIWQDTSSLESFAYGETAHRAVVERTSRERWYVEDLFARFAVVKSGGTVDGRDPLSGTAKTDRRDSDP